MSNKMLIDAVHLEEIRVALLRGNRVEDFDFESASKKPLRGNIYLAKVTRVEPSLQAAFVDYGGNRHGFLAFNEIHPDYYQIPVADRQELLRQEMEDQEEEDASEDETETSSSDDASDAIENSEETAPVEAADVEPEAPGESDADDPTVTMAADNETVVVTKAVEAQDLDPDETENAGEIDAEAGEDADAPSLEAENSDEEPEAGSDGETDQEPETVNNGDEIEELPRRRSRRPRSYKIQEVIKRRQVLLVQVVKEERGNKGAALTTYLSLAGRYSVLMPNTARGGGISRKISSATDRKRLKDVASSLSVPEGMGVILRTAGANRTKPEVRRDFEYLLRLWENVRTLTLDSHAPSLVYEEGNLIKRAIRDLYSKEIDQIIVAGEEGHKEAKDFMRMLMPSHAKNVKLYGETTPLFAAHRIETQLDGLFVPEVTLKSGGYIVINQTEALVAIDVNSGRSTKEHSIEDTALKTNLEAAEEISRQLRLRDLAGLVVIDFIDMDERRNNRAVEKKLKDCLKNDRARIQVGRISSFGLMEMSRQRMRSSVLEGSTTSCPHCNGTGTIRSVQSVALHILRVVEESARKLQNGTVVVECAVDAALYVLNNKRLHISQLEEELGVSISIVGTAECTGIETQVQFEGEQSSTRNASASVITPELNETAEDHSSDQGDDEQQPRKRRRRRRRNRSENAGERADAEAAIETESGSESGGTESEASGEEEGDDSPRRTRRRGRRGGRRNRRGNQDTPAEASAEEASDETLADGAPEAEGEATVEPQADADSDEQKPKRRRSRRKTKPVDAEPNATEPASAAETSDAEATTTGTEQDAEALGEKPKRRRTRRKKTEETEAGAEEAAPSENGATTENGASSASAAGEIAPVPKTIETVIKPDQIASPAPELGEVAPPETPPAPKRRGWWQRTFSPDKS